MKRLVGVVLCFSVLMIVCNKKQTKTNQEDLSKKTMYVNATDGLRVRNSPSSDGEILGLLEDLTKVTATKKDNNTVNIGGVDGKWVYITEPIEGWVFDGFLVNYKPHIKKTSAKGTTKENTIEEKLIGNWICEGIFCTFYSGGRFKRGLLETSYSANGDWEIKDDKIIINITYRGEDNGEWYLNEDDEEYYEEYKYSFVDDTMILTPVKGNTYNGIYVKFGEGRDIFGNYSANADYVWESHIKYRERFGGR
jgi:hypothetical protein